MEEKGVEVGVAADGGNKHVCEATKFTDTVNGVPRAWWEGQSLTSFHVGKGNERSTIKISDGPVLSHA